MIEENDDKIMQKNNGTERMSQNVPDFKKQKRQELEIEQTLHGKSQQTIAKTLKVSRKTVQRDMKEAKPKISDIVEDKLRHGLENHEKEVEERKKKLNEWINLEDNEENFKKITFAFRMLETTSNNYLNVLLKLRSDEVDNWHKKATAFKF